MEKEVRLGRMAGPFDSVPDTGLPSLIVSPIGLVPKADGGDRLIHQLLYPWGEGVNQFIDDEQSRVSYASFDEALACIASFGKNTAMAKLDVKSAYRLLPVRQMIFGY